MSKLLNDFCRTQIKIKATRAIQYTPCGSTACGFWAAPNPWYIRHRFHRWQSCPSHPGLGPAGQASWSLRPRRRRRASWRPRGCFCRAAGWWRCSGSCRPCCCSSGPDSDNLRFVRKWLEVYCNTFLLRQNKTASLLRTLPLLFFLLHRQRELLEMGSKLVHYCQLWKRRTII